jgi:threonine dehydratase
MRAIVFVPGDAPKAKVDAIRRHGAELREAANYDEAEVAAKEHARQTGLPFISPYNHPDVIAGAGTIALEIFEAHPNVETIVVPIGGAGLISGIAIAAKSIAPAARVVGVEVEASCAFLQSMRNGRITTIVPKPTLADGLGGNMDPDTITFDIVQKYVDDIVTVDEEEIANAILLLLEREKTVVEGAGAVTLAALINGKIPRSSGRKVVMVLSGGNIDVNVISRIIERGLVKDGRLVTLVVNVPDRPGSLAKLMAVIAEQGANVSEVHHDRIYSTTALGEVAVEARLEMRGRDHVKQLLDALRERGYEVEVIAGVSG